MPTVPVYNTPQVAPGNLPNVQNSLPLGFSEAMRAGPDQMQRIGQQMVNAGSQFAQVAIQMQADVNEAKVKEADNAAADSVREVLHNPDSGYLTQTGKNAIDGYRPTADAIDKALKDAGQGLENDAQKRMFNEVAMRRRQQALGQAETHAAVQTKQYNYDATVARIGTNERDMVSGAPAWRVPGSAYAQADATRKGEIENAIEQKLGATADKALKDAFRLELNTRAHTAVIADMLSRNQPKDAQEYFAAKLREIDPEKQDDIRKALETAGRQDNVLRYSDKLFATTKGFAAQMDKVQKDFDAGTLDAKEREAIEARIEHKRSVALSQQAEGEKWALGQAFDFLQKNPGKSVEDLPPGIYRSVLTHLPSLRSFVMAEGKTTTDPQTYYGLRQMAANTPEEFVKMDLMASRSKLSEGDWKHLVELQGSINKNDAKAMEQQRVLGRTLKSINAELASIGIDTSPNPNTDKGKKAAEELARFNVSLMQAIDAKQVELKRPLTGEEARTVGLEQIKQGWLQGSGIFFDDKVRRYQVPGGGQRPFLTVRYNDIPQASRADIEADIREQGRAVTKEEVERTYQRALDKGKVK